MKIIKKCPICNKTAEVSNEFKLNGLTITNYACGHVRSRAEKKVGDLSIVSKDGKKPYQYQLEGAAWAIKNNARVLIADEMGVGKTLQSFLVCKSDPSEYLPALIVCKPGLKTQMAKEAYRWCDWISQIIENENEFILPGFPIYIIGYETLAHSEFTNKKGKTITRGIKDISEWIKKINPKTIILDECQNIKNKEAKRTKGVQNLVRAANDSHLLALSGTPILNNAKEYFPILNMLQPDKFPNESSYIMRWCDSYFSGNVQKVGGIRDPKAFKDFTSDFIIRRTRSEVLPNLPTVDRRFKYEELGEKVEEAYKTEFKKFQDFYYGIDGSSTFERDGNILAYLSKMRHLTGIAKIPGVVDFAEEFLKETDRKLVIFTHHIDVARELVERIGIFAKKELIYCPSPVDPKLIEQFHLPESRILIGNTLSLGEGHNLQCCSDFILMEREWNPPKEEQAEGRFPRPGQKEDKITGTYFTAVGTVDEFFAEIVEQKRAIFSSTMNGVQVKWNESQIIKELAEVLAMNGGKKWGF